MALLHQVHDILFALTIPMMFGIFFLTHRIWPSVILGEISVSLIAFEEGRLVGAAPVIIGFGIVYLAIALYLQKRTTAA